MLSFDGPGENLLTIALSVALPAPSKGSKYITSFYRMLASLNVLVAGRLPILR